MEKNSKKLYNIGLDIGVASVGWAVTDENSNLLKKEQNNMWGSRLFEEASPASERRLFRGTRRRINRRNERIKIFQSLVLDDLEKHYSNFLPMLRESSLFQEEKTSSDKINGVKYNLFSDLGLTDQNYYKRYPTIYHLRAQLIKSNEKQDIRLVYLAIHHILKYRGNFLYEGDMKSTDRNIEEQILELFDFLKEKQIYFSGNISTFISILKDKNKTRGQRKEDLISLFSFNKLDKPIISNIIASILGYQFDINKIFEVELESSKLCFESEIQNEEEIINALQDDSKIWEQLFKIYSWYVLQDILQEKTYLSEAFIEKYGTYKKDLKLLKYIYKTYLPNNYAQMFRKQEKNNYVTYKSQEEFYKRILKDIELLPDCKEKLELTEKINNKNFLVKLNTTDNSAIPYQLQKKELEIILENQSSYYPTLKENKDKILGLLTFRIPYYIGPLSKNENSKFAWIVRNSDEKILPWTFDKIVDIDKTAEKFIRKMTNKCTYLMNKDVIPKESLLYSEFCVRNELANIRINQHKLSKETKNLIIEKLFKKVKKVTKEQVKQLLLKEQIYLSISSFDGLSEGDAFSSHLISYINMEKIFGEIKETNISMIEKIIEWITLFEDKSILKRKIEKEYKEISQEQLNKLLKLRYSGWSRLSKELLTELKSFDNHQSIMEKLSTTTGNFMQILKNEKYGFEKQINDLLPKKEKQISDKDIAEIPCSPALKRSIWQCIKIVKEIVKVMKCEPQNIYIEFARGEETVKRRKDNRAKSLLKIYDSLVSDSDTLKFINPQIYKELKQKQDEKDFNERLYLYFTQNGKSMYSGKSLDINKLSFYEVDHIIPRNYIKDDSLSNKVLVYKEENQRKSGSLLLDDEIINKQQRFWKFLYDSNLITSKKYNNLCKRKMFETEEEKVKFVQRQLVETRQIIKYVSNLLVSEYSHTSVFSLRAELTHNFREQYEIYKNRNVNNYHHAQDAYIISVVGNSIDKSAPDKREYQYAEYVPKYLKQYTTTFNVMDMIKETIDISKIKKVLNYKDCYITKKLEEQTGNFYNQTLYGPANTSSSNTKPVIPLKQNMSVEKYGGYSGENKAYCTIYSYYDKNHKYTVCLIGIPVQVSYIIATGKLTEEQYIKDKELKSIESSNFKILKRKLLKYQEFTEDSGIPMLLISDSEIKTCKELIIDEYFQKIIYCMNSFIVISEKELEKLFNYLLHKIRLEYPIYDSAYEKVLNAKTLFLSLEYKKKVSVLNELIYMMQRGYGNLKDLGLSTALGRKTTQSFLTKRLMTMTFYDKSVTGMYERRYTINGLENNNCK